MPSNPFEAALSQPESDLPYARPVALLSVGDFSEPELPEIAENYLDAFCDPNRSGVQRRWIGITLTRMLEKSDCVAHTLRLSEPLKNLGVIIMSHEEQGVIKIIAGLIMRQGLEQNIEYHKFWPTEKLADSTLRFPRRPDSTWMRDFHVFLDSFGKSTVSDLDNQTFIGYIGSVTASDGFIWAESGNDICAVTLETGMLAIVVSDAHLENCHFLDIPVSHIISTRSALRPHAVQTQPTGCESCSVVLSLKSGPWTYCLNSMQRAATEISLVFKHSKDAVQWEDCIKQHQKAHEEYHHISHIPSVYTKTSPVRQDRQQKSPCSHSSHSLAEQSGLQKHSEPYHDSLPPKAYAQPRQIRPQTSLQEENTSFSSQFRRIECRKERQTRPSRAAKQNALKKLGSQFNNVDGYGQKDGRQHQTGLATPGTASSSKGKDVFNDTKSGNLHAGHTEGDEEYVPTKKVPEKQVSTKRKVDFQLIKNGEEIKRSRTHSDSHADLTVTAKTERDRLQIPMKLFSSASSRHSLIEGLEVSQELVDSNASFKKPTLPVYNARYPSTPTKPKRKVVETQRRLRTPREVRSFHGDIFSQMPSSPPIPCQQDEGLNWSRESAAEAAILSSNSKPVPASPNAESTAISGHADNDDVAFEKQTGDTQIARSDPFTRRPKGGKATSFLRRLTGEEPADIPFDLGTDVSQISPSENSPRLDAAVTEPLPQLTSGRKKTNHPTLVGTQEIDGGLDMESDILNGDLLDDQKHYSESDLTSFYLSSSPPRLGSLANHSSTSATPLSSSQSALLWSDAHEIFRETSLEPSQRNLHDLLACTSKEVMGRIVASDSSPCDIEGKFVKDRNCVLQSLLSRDNNDHECGFLDMEAKCEALCKEL